MTVERPTPYETLKEILRLSREPEGLDDHPWTCSLFVREALAESPNLASVGPGQQLVSAIAGLFPQLRPAHPPRRGLRLDPRWGEFGLLAALYFMPYTNGNSFPTSLLDAWGRIDPAILFYVYGKPADALRNEQIKKYSLVGAELEYGSPSTLSDWHRKGVRRLVEIILNRERFLARNSMEASAILRSGDENIGGEVGATEATQSKPRKGWLKTSRLVWISLLLGLALALGLGTLKARRVYESGRRVYQDVSRLQGFDQAPIGLETFDQARPILEDARIDLERFKGEAGPFLWLSPRLGWVPVYGGDLAAAPELLALAEHFLDASDITLMAARPLLGEFDAAESTLEPARLTELLVEAQPRLLEARSELDQARLVRKDIQVERLSPRLGGLLVEDLDPMLELADDGLSLATALPAVLGATHEGPKTYMLLVQNEDELRPTGGFITSVGNLVVHNGQVISLDFERVGDQDDWSQPYPAAPWQLQEYMNSRVLVLRDANWFSDFPTTVSWVEYLYAYTHSHSVDGVIAFDQRFLVLLLGQLGPLEVAGAPYPLTDKNVIAYMRQAKIPPEDIPISTVWYRKEFIGEIADALFDRLLSGEEYDWLGMVRVLSQALAERHLLLQFDDPAIAALTAEHGWDNALRPGQGDFLMLTDTNIGFNKTNANVSERLAYDVDLTDLSAPQAALVVTHENTSRREVQCIQWDIEHINERGDHWYPMDRCYWNYLRVYKQEGVELLDASPHAIPGEWMLLGKGVPARVDDLEEQIPGVRGFGTLLVVPGSEVLNTGFRFALPETVILSQEASNQLAYHLKVHKQPGTLAIPLTFRLHLPEHASLDVMPEKAIVQGQHLLLETDLRRDVEIEVLFSVP